MFDCLLAEVIEKAVKAASSPAKISIETEGGLFAERKVTIEGENATIFALSSILVAHVVRKIVPAGASHGEMLERITESAKDYLQILGEGGKEKWNQ